MGNVVLALIVAVLILIAAVGVYVMVLSSHNDDMAGWVTDSYGALRASELGVKSFDVHMRDTRIGDVFSSFPADEADAMTAQSIAHEWEHFKVERPHPQFRHRATHSFVG